MRACARNFLTLKNGISYLSLAKWSERALQLALRPFSELRSDLRSGSIFGVALRPRSGFSERRSGAPLRSAAPRSAALQYSDDNWSSRQLHTLQLVLKLVV